MRQGDGKRLLDWFAEFQCVGAMILGVISLFELVRGDRESARTIFLFAVILVISAALCWAGAYAAAKADGRSNRRMRSRGQETFFILTVTALLGVILGGVITDDVVAILTIAAIGVTIAWGVRVAGQWRYKRGDVIFLKEEGMYHAAKILDVEEAGRETLVTVLIVDWAHKQRPPGVSTALLDDWVRRGEYRIVDTTLELLEGHSPRMVFRDDITHAEWIALDAHWPE